MDTTVRPASWQRASGFGRALRPERIAAAVSLGGGVIAGLAGSEPLAGPLAGFVLVIACAGVVIWASATSPWWALATAAGAGAAIAGDPIVATVGVVGFGGALAVGLGIIDGAVVRTLIGAVAVNVLARSELVGFHGASAMIALATCALLVMVGLRSRQLVARRRARWAGGVLLLGVVVAVIGLGIASATARPALTDAVTATRDGIKALEAGDLRDAAAHFDRGAGGFRDANRHLGGALAAPARLVPVLSQHASAAADLSRAAADTLTEAADTLAEFETADLALSDGAIDLDSLASLEPPLVALQGSLRSLDAAIEAARSPWLVSPIAEEISEVDAELDVRQPQLDDVIAAVRLAPAMLGADGERTYLVLFTSPAEARGLGGFIGNYAELAAVDGQLSVREFTRRSELESAITESGARCEPCPAEFLQRYGRFGFTTAEDGAAVGRAWSNVTMPAHFPYVAEVASTLYPQSGGRSIDGVLAMDPYVVEALMGFVGPVELPAIGTTVLPEQAAEFILHDQYLLTVDQSTGRVDNDERIDALQTLGEAVLTRLLDGELPDPVELARDLGELSDERRLLFWSSVPDEVRLLDRTGLSGALPELGDDGGFSVSVTNAGGSKIDYFLDRATTTRVESTPQGRRLVADVTLTNAAPDSGYPRHVIGNLVGVPEGTSRLFVTFYGPETLVSAELDGRPIGFEQLPEAGWSAYSHFVEIPAGGSARYQLAFMLPPGLGPTGEPVLFEQPLTRRTSG